MKTYAEKLRDPRWQRKRLEIMQRDKFTCTCCGDGGSTLNVHHWEYMKDPWDVPNGDLITVCESCHSQIEECKKLCKGFLRQSDFRSLLKKMQSLLECVRELKISSSNTQIVISPKYTDTPIHAIGAGYRAILNGETIKQGDEFCCISGIWVEFGAAIGKPYNSYNYGYDFPDDLKLPNARRKLSSGLSAFDSMIIDAPEFTTP